MRNLSIKETNYEARVLKIAGAIDGFEGYAQPHAIRLAELADATAQKFNLASHDRYSIRQAALIHDIGEMLMNRDYIKSSRLLREDELIDMQRHTVIGEQEAAKRGFNRAVQLFVRWHHEWWNGAGYPDALAGEQIPLGARILRVCDAYLAITEERPHRAALSKADAKFHLTEWAAIEFDPKVVRAFLSSEKLNESHSETSDKESETRDAEIMDIQTENLSLA